jgi:hypothetical protein
LRAASESKSEEGIRKKVIQVIKRQNLADLCLKARRSKKALMEQLKGSYKNRVGKLSLQKEN